ncbi:MAG TPA: hypothetical protein EYH06_00555 [Chromatiales bacterium]|nr:hypothetical protein [Thiotrichales bacterium]HIP67062.1 hypothetical protein [Chromatiales bacterium]
MNSPKQILIIVLSLLTVGLMVAIFYSPIWWVSLTAPNYPEEAFPDGVRINFHMNGVFNGCKKVEKTEITEEIALDCVHEMDTINHYVGMYPIAAGGVIEKAFSPFLMSLLAMMVFGFMCRKPRLRMALLTVGFAAIAIWMYMTFYGANGLKLQNTGYLTALVSALDQDTEKESEEAGIGSGEALIARLKAAMEKTSGQTSPAAASKDTSEKENSIEHLKNTFLKDQERKPASEREEWNGSGLQMLSWHYRKNLGRYFNNPAEINPMADKMTLASHVVFWGIIAAMLLLIFGARRNSGLLYWLLVLVPMALPLFFIIEYSGWLWWYGHSLNEMGAFTVKPFMPTVFGDGKVAQFTTHSYPHTGFGLMVLLAVVLAVVALLRRKQLREQDSR